MRKALNIIIIIVITSSSCKTKTFDDNKETVNNSIIYPSRAYVCFDLNNDERKRSKRTFKLGDSLSTVLQFLDLKIDSVNPDNIFELKEPVIKKRKHGTGTISILATFDTAKRLKNFRAFWHYKGDKTEKARSDFYNLILDNSLSCLWEESINIYKPTDTLTMYFIDKHRDQFVTDFRDTIWKATFECRFE